MVDEGETAPSFELPAVRDGEFEEIALEKFLGENVIILGFYPGDFNPVCDDTSSGLDDLDLFTMQKDITILAVSGDSVFSHRAFAEEYDLHIPLLADVRGEVAAEYGVATEDEPYLTRRAVFVIDHNEEIEYAWVADDVAELPNTDELRAAIENIGDDRTAQARYRVGHAHYVEGRRAFTSAMSAFEDNEWMLASRDFEQAADEFDEARDEFNTAVRFSDDSEATRYFERAERKSEALWRAANWLNDSAAAFASGEGLHGEELKEDAEGPLETARDIHEPPQPDDFPPEEDPQETDETPSFLSSDEEVVDNTLDLDEDTIEDAADGVETEDGQPAAPEGTAGDDQAAGPSQAAAVDDEPLTRGGDDGGRISDADGLIGDTDGDAGEEPESDIDDEELEAITAELEEQNVAAEKAAEAGDGPESDADGDVDTIDDDVKDEDLELELADPTEDEDDEEDDDLSDDIGGDDHGVPDSL